MFEPPKPCLISPLCPRRNRLQQSMHEREPAFRRTWIHVGRSSLSNKVYCKTSSSHGSEIPLVRGIHALGFIWFPLYTFISPLEKAQPLFKYKKVWSDSPLFENWVSQNRIINPNFRMYVVEGKVDVSLFLRNSFLDPPLHPQNLGCALSLPCRCKWDLSRGHSSGEQLGKRPNAVNQNKIHIITCSLTYLFDEMQGCMPKSGISMQ